jgi:hypothetical protein
MPGFCFKYWPSILLRLPAAGRDFGFYASDFYDYHYIKKIIFSRFVLAESVENPLVLNFPLNLKHQ